MSDTNKTVVIITAGLNDELASVGWSVANGAINSGFELTVFLVSSGVDWARKGAGDEARLNPLDPTMKEMIDNVVKSGSQIMVCPPCGQMRGYTEDNIIDGVIFAGSKAMFEVVKNGATTVSF